MVALARVQKPRAEIIVILYLQIIGKLSVTHIRQTTYIVSRLAWERHQIVMIFAKPWALT